MFIANFEKVSGPINTAAKAVGGVAKKVEGDVLDFKKIKEQYRKKNLTISNKPTIVPNKNPKSAPAAAPKPKPYGMQNVPTRRPGIFSE